MKLINNTGTDRVIDKLRSCLTSQASLDVASPSFSLFAFAETRNLLEKIDKCRLILPSTEDNNLCLFGGEVDRAFRNQLQVRWLALQFAKWIEKKSELRNAPTSLPQSTIITSHTDPAVVTPAKAGV